MIIFEKIKKNPKEIFRREKTNIEFSFFLLKAGGPNPTRLKGVGDPFFPPTVLGERKSSPRENLLRVIFFEGDILIFPFFNFSLFVNNVFFL